MQQCIKRIIYYKQVGFIPAKQGRLSIQKSVDLIHKQHKKTKPHDHINRGRKNILQNPFTNYHEKAKRYNL